MNHAPYLIVWKPLNRQLLAIRGLQNHPCEYRCEEQVEVEFGGLEWEWHPIQANEKYLKWIEDNVVVRPHARHSKSPRVCGGNASPISCPPHGSKASEL